MTEMQYRKTVGEFNTKISNLFKTFDLYGMGVYIPHTELLITEAAIKLHRDLSEIESMVKESK